jgi:hypothetical protein
MQWMVMDDLMVCVTSPGEPDKATVTRFLSELRTKPIRRILATPLSTSDELSDERLACGEICASRGIKVALMVESSVAADYASAAAFSDASLAAFTWDQMDAALAHVDVRGAAAAAPVRAALADLRKDRAAIAA